MNEKVGFYLLLWDGFFDVPTWKKLIIVSCRSQISMHKVLSLSLTNWPEISATGFPFAYTQVVRTKDILKVKELINHCNYNH